MRVKDAVAACLTEASGQYLSGETLAQKLGVSRNAVWKAVRLLQDEGFPIEAKKKTGYRLAQGVDLLTEESVRPYLHSRILGHPLYVYSELGSTNNTCKTLVRDHARHGTVVAANCQTAGKGRQGPCRFGAVFFHDPVRGGFPTGRTAADCLCCCRRRQSH